MANIRIVLCDSNHDELEGYGKICRAICDSEQIPATLMTFSSSNALLFEMSECAFSSMVNILIIEPDGGFENVASAVRKLGYNGIILYLSRSTDPKVFFSAFDNQVRNFAEKGDLDRFSYIFEEALQVAKEEDARYIAVSCAGEYRTIDVRDIYYFETTLDHMVCVWYAGGKFVFPSTLSNLEERLKNCGFMRIHRSYLVSMSAVHRISYEEVILNNGISIPIGRGNYSALKNALETWKIA